MATPLFPDDFKEFLRLLNAHRVDYLVVGGYAVGLHGYPRATIDLDVWVATTAANAERLIDALRDFGFDGLTLPVISLDDLKTNKRAAGRHKDLADLDNLP